MAIIHQLFDPPLVFEFSAVGIREGVRVRGIIKNIKEDISGVVEAVYPQWVLIKKKNGTRTTLHMGHIIGDEIYFFKVY